MRLAVVERRSDLVAANCPVKIDHYVALATALGCLGIPEDGEIHEVYRAVSYKPLTLPPICSLYAEVDA